MKGFLLGLILGGLLVYLYYDKAQIEADTKQVKKDDKTASQIEYKTTEALKTNTVTKVVTKWRTKPVTVPRDLTDEEIDNLCANRAVPADIMQSIRSEAARAWARFNDL